RVPQRFDLHAPEQLEPVEIDPALHPRGFAIRLAGTERDLPFDRLGADAAVAGNDHVIHDDLRPFDDRETDVGARVVLVERWLRRDDDALEATVVIRLHDRVAIGQDVDDRIHAAWCRRDPLAQLRLAQRLVTLEGHRSNLGPRTFDDG